MATTRTTLTTTPNIFPFSGISEVVQDKTRYPRAEVRASIVSSVIPAAGSGNDRRVTVQIIAPPNFSYALGNLTFATFGGSGAVCGFKTAYCFIQLSSNPNRFIPCMVNVESTDYVQGYPQLHTFSVVPPKEIMVPENSGAMVLNLEIFDDTLAGPEAYINLDCRWVQYDINQAHHVSVNTPTLTR